MHLPIVQWPSSEHHQEQFANGREEEDSKTAFQGFIRDCVTPEVALRLRNAELKATFEMRYQAMKEQVLSEAEIFKNSQ